ncbi:MAG: hypothetical protein M0Q99_12555, partial [Candidatus Cloacimonetes bacterium]|nr:hypothetical protein [Candidatus Cloacimonadota bacterium]
FVRRFSKQTEREQIDNLGREFKEELIDRKILNWKKIEYRYCEFAGALQPVDRRKAGHATEINLPV